ncbi:MAG: glycosyltransferase family 2 protein, partial [Acidobacteriaceae bacterium]
MPRVAAVAVLYHPELEPLRRLIMSAVGQAEAIFVIDNTPDPILAVRSLMDSEGSIRYISLGRNAGIAAAQNAGIRASMEAGFTHVLLLDQDSTLPEGMVNRLLSGEERLLCGGQQVAAVGPQFWDEKTGKAYPAVRLEYFRIRKLYLDTRSTEPVETDYLIASGSMIRVSVLREVGLMREDLFIDWVDVEWGLR